MAFDFKLGYDRSRFINFLRTDLFGDKFIQSLTPIKLERQTAFFEEDKIFQLGRIQLGEKEVSVLEIKQRSKNDPRVTLTQDTFKLMGDLGIDNAIVSLYVDNNSSWRFSLLTTKYEDFKKTTSNPRRFSFILGPHEKTRTVDQQLIKNGSIKDFEDLVSRFNVEVVRNEFFETYLELFVRLYKAIQKDSEFVHLLESKNVDIVSFTKNLLGKIIFLYFIQQKGWLGLGKRTTTVYGQGDKDFMRKLWINFKDQGESMCTKEKTGYFYNDYLEWLFYDGLNVDRRKDDDWFEQLQMKVPYLNGGLFKEEYKGRKDNDSKINNDVFSNKNEDGILDIFDRYNFTIDEDSLYDTDIAVDPEMLGRIFEKMISISSDNIKEVVEIYDNKKKNSKFDFGKDLNKKLGAFYTPREVVHYMTKESLIAYLNNKTNLSEKNIRILFDLKEKFLLNEDIEKSDYSNEDISEIKNNIVDVDEALKNLKILDPAVGSGAFPMGLLHEISSMRYYIYGVFIDRFGDKAKEYMIFNKDKNRDTVSLYKVKKDIILNNIYGVDIDPGAIDIAKLRFRLTLVVDEQEPEPLPNFEFKFVCANSLIPLDKPNKDSDEFSKEIDLDYMKSKKKDYFNASNLTSKKNIKQDILGYLNKKNDLFSDNLRTRQISEFLAHFDDPKHSNSFFDPSLMLSEWRGFDIVIGNPPYIQLQKNIEQDSSKPKKLLGSLYEPYNFQTFEKRGDIYCLFYEKGVGLLKNGGICTYITSNKWMRAGYGESLRGFLSKITNPLYLIDLGPGVFDTATVDSNILILEKKQVKTFNIKGVTFSDDDNFSEIYEYLKKPLILTNVSSDSWIILNSLEKSIKEKIETVGTPLKDWNIDINYGIKTGCNEVFIIDENKKNELIQKDPKSAEIIRPILRGRDIKRYGYDFANLWLLNIHNGIKQKSIAPININNYPYVKSYLNNHLEKIRNRDDQGVTPYNLRNCAYMDDFYKPKILYSEIVRTPQFYLDKKGDFFAEATTFMITGNENLEYLITLLNSKLVSNCFRLLYAGGGLGSSGYRYKKQFLQNLPLPKFTGSHLQLKIINDKDNEYLIGELLNLDLEEINHLLSI